LGILFSSILCTCLNITYLTNQQYTNVTIQYVVKSKENRK
jgi:hypothetical protein